MHGISISQAVTIAKTHFLITGDCQLCLMEMKILILKSQRQVPVMC